MCAWRRSLKVSHQVRLVTHEALQRAPGLTFVLLTLTVKNCRPDVLGDTIDAMYRGWDRLNKRREVKSSVLGWFRALEVTHNVESETYHPHFHAVLALPQDYFKHGYIAQSRWVELWQRSLKVDYAPIVDVRKIRRRSADRQEVDQAAAEVAKYASDPGSYLLDDEESTDKAVEVLDAALAGRRLLAYGGLLKEVWQALEAVGKVDDTEDGDLVHVDEDSASACRCSVCQSDMLEHVYRWHVGYRAYVG